MNAAITKAKSLVIKFEGTVPLKADDHRFQGRLVITTDNKFRIDMTEDASSSALLVVSDGTKTTESPSKEVGKKFGPARVTSKDATKNLLSTFARSGICMPMVYANVIEEGKAGTIEEVDPSLKASDFRFGKKEKVDGKNAQAIDYKLTMSRRDDQIVFDATVWMDVQTHLPLKRVLTIRLKVEKARPITETYLAVSVDGKIDEKTFELPKK